MALNDFENSFNMIENPSYLNPDTPEEIQLVMAGTITLLNPPIAGHPNLTFQILINYRLILIPI